MSRARQTPMSSHGFITPLLIVLGLTIIAPPASVAADTWTTVKCPTKASMRVWLFDVAALTATDAWALGPWYNADSTKRGSFVLHYDGASWKTVKVPGVAGRQCELGEMHAFSSSDIWAVGNASNASGDTTLAMHYDGASWSIVSTPSPTGAVGISLTGMAGTAPDDIWAVGHWTKDWDAGYYQTLILHYDGATWSIVPTPNVTNGDNRLWSISALSRKTAIAVGSAYTRDYQTLKAIVLTWDGKTWKTAPAPKYGIEPMQAETTGLHLVGSMLYTDSKGVKSWFAGGRSFTKANAALYTAKASSGAPKWKSLTCPSVSSYGSQLNDIVTTNGDRRIVGVGGGRASAGWNAMVEIFRPTGATFSSEVSLYGIAGVTNSTYLTAAAAVPPAAAMVDTGSTTVWVVGYSEDSNGKAQPLILKGELSQ